MNHAHQRRQHHEQVEAWNANHPPGTPVTLKKDDGTHVQTTTRSHAIISAAGYPVIWLSGVAGHYALECVEPLGMQIDASGHDPVAARRTLAAIITAAGGKVVVTPAILQSLSADTRIGMLDQMDGSRIFYVEKF